MTDPVQLLDSEGEKLGKDVTFDPVMAGETETRTLLARNQIDKDIEDMQVRAFGEDVSVDSSPSQLEPGEEGEIVVSFSPGVDKAEPVQARIRVEGNYVVR